MTTTNNEKRIQKVARNYAKAVIALRNQGLLVAARKLQDDGIRTCEEMRAGRL